MTNPRAPKFILSTRVSEYPLRAGDPPTRHANAPAHTAPQLLRTSPRPGCSPGTRNVLPEGRGVRSSLRHVPPRGCRPGAEGELLRTRRSPSKRVCTGAHPLLSASTAAVLTRPECPGTACDAISCRSPCCPGRCSAWRGPPATAVNLVGNRPGAFPAGAALPTREIRAPAGVPARAWTAPTARGTSTSTYNQPEGGTPTLRPGVPLLQAMESANDPPLDSAPF